MIKILGLSLMGQALIFISRDLHIIIGYSEYNKETREEPSCRRHDIPCSDRLAAVRHDMS